MSMKREQAYEELEGVKIFVVYNDGCVGEYRSEVSAVEEINLRDGAASGVKKVIIGNELGMLAIECKQLRCFTHAGAGQVEREDEG